MAIKVTRWEGPQISEAGIRRIHVPQTDFRISPQRFEPDVRFPGSAQKGLVYVLIGSCAWNIDGQRVIMVGGDIAEIPAGSYEFEVIGDQPCDLVHVWNLKELWEHRDNQLSEPYTTGNPLPDE